MSGVLLVIGNHDGRIGPCQIVELVLVYHEIIRVITGAREWKLGRDGALSPFTGGENTEQFCIGVIAVLSSTYMPHHEDGCHRTPCQTQIGDFLPPSVRWSWGVTISPLPRPPSPGPTARGWAPTPLDPGCPPRHRSCSLLNPRGPAVCPRTSLFAD